MTPSTGKNVNFNNPIKVLYEDEYLFAVAKPPGMFVHRTALSRERGFFLLQEARNLYGSHLYPVHRLDRPTSGVVIFATTPQVAKVLAEYFRKKEIEKYYIAVVRGWTGTSGVIDSHLVKITENPTPVEQLKQQKAVTKYETIARTEIPVAVSRYPTSRYSLVLANPITGRRHQIRRHFKHISHPIIGDVLYGDGKHNRFFRDNFGIKRLLLHSFSMKFKHPVYGHTVKITSPPGDDFMEVLSKLGWKEVMEALLAK
ncbi:pseudouridine synthase [Thermovirga lienii]|jgi:tRNA pseudouridine65 synthase|uniref:pseudouridine synthase n=1 Tax=Thermovirga lienii TaxID=336261 RepID=UPI000EEDB376|nr:pseudouridylate synthase [Thermovirga lienii]